MLLIQVHGDNGWVSSGSSGSMCASVVPFDGFVCLLRAWVSLRMKPDTHYTALQRSPRDPSLLCHGQAPPYGLFRLNGRAGFTEELTPALIRLWRTIFLGASMNQCVKCTIIRETVSSFTHSCKLRGVFSNKVLVTKTRLQISKNRAKCIKNRYLLIELATLHRKLNLNEEGFMN